MSNYRRLLAHGSSIFFTVVTHQRRPILTDPIARSALREAIRRVRVRRPFELDAIALLPDLRDDESVDVEKLRLLLGLKGIGPISATLFVREFFGWRLIKNRRELASLAGLAPTPYASGDSQREQGISKAGNRRLRWMAVEIAWSWLRYQPESALSQWYQGRFGSGNARIRKVGIVALARKL